MPDNNTHWRISHEGKVFIVSVIVVTAFVALFLMIVSGAWQQ